MTQTALALFLLGALMVTTTATAYAQRCLPRDKMVAYMADRWKEQRVAGGLQGTNLVEIFASLNGETWTLVATDPNSMVSCMITSGEWWQQHLPEEVEPDQPGDPIRDRR